MSTTTILVWFLIGIVCAWIWYRIILEENAHYNEEFTVANGIDLIAWVCLAPLILILSAVIAVFGLVGMLVVWMSKIKIGRKCPIKEALHQQKVDVFNLHTKRLKEEINIANDR